MTTTTRSVPSFCGRRQPIRARGRLRRSPTRRRFRQEGRRTVLVRCGHVSRQRRRIWRCPGGGVVDEVVQVVVRPLRGVAEEPEGRPVGQLHRDAAVASHQVQRVVVGWANGDDSARPTRGADAQRANDGRCARRRRVGRAAGDFDPRSLRAELVRAVGQPLQLEAEGAVSDGDTSRRRLTIRCGDAAGIGGDVDPGGMIHPGDHTAHLDRPGGVGIDGGEEDRAVINDLGGRLDVEIPAVERCGRCGRCGRCRRHADVVAAGCERQIEHEARCGRSGRVRSDGLIGEDGAGECAVDPGSQCDPSARLGPLRPSGDGCVAGSGRGGPLDRCGGRDGGGRDGDGGCGGGRRLVSRERDRWERDGVGALVEGRVWRDATRRCEECGSCNQHLGECDSHVAPPFFGTSGS